ncbi:hypothetical protein M9Y10_043424 [Tritrichomonas musculus]|uniref:Palmitoyltransferase n=1 Tax=Tritrichomonas musculus TaxID=1915356 RepID=A0ABR2K0S6_9EUKA
MGRSKLTFIDILPRVLILSAWGVLSGVYLWDSSTCLRKAKIRKKIIQDWVFIGLFILFSIIFLWCYWVTCWSDPGSTERYYQKLGVLNDIQNQRIPPELSLLPVCKVCHLPKPERAHHCSTCDQCYFRFDHHCPIIGNCVALYNFKGFILMPIYGAILCILLSIELFIQHKTYFCIIPLPLAIYFLYFSLSYCPKIIHNYTTLEKLFVRYERKYAQDKCRNFNEFFDGFLFFLPTKPRVSGFRWSGEHVEEKVKELENKMNIRNNKIYSQDEDQVAEDENIMNDSINDVNEVVDNKGK